MYRIGMDLGSSYVKAVAVDKDNKIVDSSIAKTGLDFKNTSRKIINELTEKYPVEMPVFTCGYGRDQVEEAVTCSEITALAKAAYSLLKHQVFVLDIGGQDTKFIEINDSGNIERFNMNRKCASGTGAFLEEIAFKLNISSLELNNLAQNAQEDIKLNSFCTVFATSEIVGLIKKNVSIESIARGVYNSIIDRCKEIVPPGSEVFLTGGIPYYHSVFVSMMKKEFENRITYSKLAQFLSAYGSVLMHL